MSKTLIESKKILFLTHYFPPEGNAPASRVHEMAKRWVEAGHKVTVITCAPNVPNGVVYDGYKNKLWQKECVDGINVIRVWTYMAANKGTMLRILNFITYMFSAFIASFFVKKPDMLIATSPQFFCGWAGVLVKWFRRVPLILEIRDIWPESIVAVGAMKKSAFIRILEWLELKMYKHATHIVTVGNGYKKNLEAKGVPATKISIVTNGVDVGFYTSRPANEELRNKYAINSNYVCAYIGTLGMASGLDIVIETAIKLKENNNDNIKLMLIGDGAIKSELEEKIKANNLNNVIMTGRQPKEMMPEFLATVDSCLVHLRKSDLFKTVLPSKIFEAAAMERPIIMGVEGDAAELVTEARAGICIEPDNANDLYKALIKLSADPDLSRQYGQQGNAYVREHFNRDRLASAYLEEIHLVLAKNSVEYAKGIVRHAGELAKETVLHDAERIVLKAREAGQDSNIIEIPAKTSKSKFRQSV